MENARCCHGKERFLKFDLNTIRRVLNEQNWLPIKKNKFSQFDVSNKARPILTDFKGCRKCCLAINHQLFQKATAQMPSNFTLNF
jgi:hypothetical protein